MRGALLWLGCVACAQAGTPDNRYIDASPQSDSSTKLIDARAIDATSASCTSSATCGSAVDLGTINGDKGADSKTASGYQSAWYSIRVNEGDSGVFSAGMTLTVTLDSPASANYDLFVYLNTGNDVVECSTPNGAATGLDPQSRTITWGESGTFSNGNDDSRTASIEIRPSGTSCSSSNTWSLTVNGN